MPKDSTILNFSGSNVSLDLDTISLRTRAAVIARELSPWLNESSKANEMTCNTYKTGVPFAWYCFYGLRQYTFKQQRWISKQPIPLAFEKLLCSCNLCNTNEDMLMAEIEQSIRPLVHLKSDRMPARPSRPSSCANRCNRWQSWGWYVCYGRELAWDCCCWGRYFIGRVSTSRLMKDKQNCVIIRVISKYRRLTQGRDESRLAK